MVKALSTVRLGVRRQFSRAEGRRFKDGKNAAPPARRAS